MAMNINKKKISTRAHSKKNKEKIIDGGKTNLTFSIIGSKILNKTILITFDNSCSLYWLEIVSAARVTGIQSAM